MDNNEFSEFNSILRLLLQDIITNEAYLPVVPRSPSQRVLQASLYDRNPIRHVITDEVKSTLAPIKFRDANDIENNLKCSIMCEPFQEDDDIIQLPCNHCFFVEPIMKWLTEDSCECPICRYKFDSMEKNTREEENIDIIETDVGEEDVGEEVEEENGEIYYEYEQLQQLNFDNFFSFINATHNNPSYINNIFSANESISNVNIYPMNFDIVEDLSDNDMDVD